MNALVKKGIYLRADQVDRLAQLVHETRRHGKRKFSESTLCRIALDLFLAMDINFSRYDSETELADSLIAKKTRGSKTGN